MATKSKYKKGNIFHTKGGSTIRVMDVIEGYVFGRYRGAYPFVLSEKEFDERLKRECVNNG